MLDYQASVQAIADSKIQKRENHTIDGRIMIAFKLGNTPLLMAHQLQQKKFATKDNPFKSVLYKEEINKAKKDKRDLKKELVPLPRERPLLLGSLDQMVQRFLLTLRSRGVVVSRTIATDIARALIARNTQYNLGHVKIDSSWAYSLFRRMGFKRRMRTTGKAEIPEGVRKEAELLYLHDIVSIVKKHNIPSHLVMNLDQTSLKHVPAMNHTMAKKNSS